MRAFSLILGAVTALFTAPTALAQQTVCPAQAVTDQALCFATGSIDVASNRVSMTYTPTTAFVAGSELCVDVDLSAEVERGGWDQVHLRFTDGASATGEVFRDVCLGGEEPGSCATSASPGCLTSPTISWTSSTTHCYHPTPGTTSVTVTVYVRTLDSQFQCGDCGDNLGSPIVTVDRLAVVGCNGFPSASSCGDGVVDAGETCDDDNTVGGDGCSATCAIEPGAICDSAGTTCAGAGRCVGVTPGPLSRTYCYANDAGPADSTLVWSWRVAADGGPVTLDFDISGGLELFHPTYEPYYFDALILDWFDDRGGNDVAILNVGRGIDDAIAYEVWSRGALTITPTAGATEVTARVAVLSDHSFSCDQSGDPTEPMSVTSLGLTSCARGVTRYDTLSAFLAEIGGCHRVYDFNGYAAGTAAPLVGDGFRITSEAGQGFAVTVQPSPYPSTYAEGDGTPALEPQLSGSYVSNSRLGVRFEPKPARALGLTFIDVGDVGGAVSVEAYRDGELVHLIDDLGVGAETNNHTAWVGLVFDQPVDAVILSVLEPADHFNLDNLVVVPQADSDDDGVPDQCDCAPGEPSAAGSFSEVCWDEIDNDCDGFTDGDDPACGGTGTAACATYADVTLDGDPGGWVTFGDAAWSWDGSAGLWKTASANDLVATLETQPMLIPEAACPGDFQLDLDLGGVVAADGDQLVVSWSRNGGAFAQLGTLVGTLTPTSYDLTGAIVPGDVVGLRLSYITDASGYAVGPTISRLRIYSEQDADQDLVCDACDCAPQSAAYGAECDADGDGWCAAGSGPLNPNPFYAGCAAEFAGGDPLTLGGSDCDDSAPGVNPGVTGEAAFCSDGLDNDCDGDTDGADTDCAAPTCVDGDNDGYGIGDSCLGPDCDDSENLCTTDCRDGDGDGVADCDPADDCFDADGDGYGVGDGCLGPDCDDAEPRCATDCSTDLDSDDVPDCAEDCVDADSDGYGVGDGCLGPDCDDQSAACTTTCADSDGDGLFDCKDGCLDGDGDGYGVGASCAGFDCDDSDSGCTTDCSDLNGTGTPDCAEDCVDADGDGYGVGPDCAGPDCDDAQAACTEVCDDVDGDGLYECDPAETCVDKDGDGYGAGVGCVAVDCDDSSPTCDTTCVDGDGDGRLDCDPLDDCFDADGDGYGEGAGCLGPDCDDASATCAVDCSTDLDNDSVPDCAERCVDADDDGYGVGPGCVGPDCDDTAEACTTTCADTDLDQIADCKDPCLDGDRDGYGIGDGCDGADCDDARAACTTDCADADANGTPDCAEDCADADGDGYGVGTTCLGPDCDDTAETCTTTCVDVDTDGELDCKDPCVDVDRDGYGVGAGCTGPDCDDTVNSCNISCADANGDGIPDCDEGCTDLDGDGLGVGSDCVAIDCDDRFPQCTTECVHSDGDGVPDCADDDDDGDNLKDVDEPSYNTDPLDPDSDDDGLKDGDEVTSFGTDPTDPDSDDDGLGDGVEIGLYSTDPTLADTDRGGVDDGVEIAAGTNPLDPNDDIPPGHLQGNGCAGGGPAPGLPWPLFAAAAAVLAMRRRRRGA